MPQRKPFPVSSLLSSLFLPAARPLFPVPFQRFSFSGLSCNAKSIVIGIISHMKREPFIRMALSEIRRRPTLPGRFQPSTISVLRLNFCVRDGNRWIPQAIVTGKEQGSRLLLPRLLVPSVGRRSSPPDFRGSNLPPPSLFRRLGHRTASRLPWIGFARFASALRSSVPLSLPGSPFRLPLPLRSFGFAPSKPHRLESRFRPTKASASSFDILPH